MNESVVIDFVIVDGKEAASVRNHHGCLDVLVHGVAVLQAQLFIHLVASEDGIEQLHVCGEVIRVVETFEVRQLESGAKHGADGESDTVICSLPHIEVLAWISPEGLVGLTGCHVSLGKHDEVISDLFAGLHFPGVSFHHNVFQK